MENKSRSICDRVRLVSPVIPSSIHRLSLDLPLASRHSSLDPKTPVAVMVSLQMTPLYGLCMKPATAKREERERWDEAQFHRLHSTRRAPSQTAKPRRPTDRPSSPPSVREGGGVINFPFVSLCRLQNRTERANTPSEEGHAVTKRRRRRRRRRLEHAPHVRQIDSGKRASEGGKSGDRAERVSERMMLIKKGSRVPDEITMSTFWDRALCVPKRTG